MMFKNPILLGNLAFGCLPLCGCFAEVAIWRLYRKAGEMEENHRGGTSVILVEMVSQSWNQLYPLVFEASEAILGARGLGRNFASA